MTLNVPRRLDPLEFRAWRAFLVASAAVVPRLDQELTAAHGISLNQFEVLTRVALAGRDGIRMTDLSAQVVLSPSGVTRAVDQLERRRLVQRCVFEVDKRGQLASITSEGRALLRKATDVHVRGIREHFLQHLSRDDLERLAKTMETVLDGEGTPIRPLPD